MINGIFIEKAKKELGSKKKFEIRWLKKFFCAECRMSESSL